MRTRKILSYTTSIMAVAGCFIIIGAIGNIDYHVELHEQYSIMPTIKMLIIGLSLIIPAYIRGRFV